MQKKLIALAIAAAASSAAFAQSNVTIYGNIDMGWMTTSGSNGAVPASGNVGTPNQARNFIGQAASFSHLGFKGVEDLGNGLKALFDIQYRFNPDTGGGLNQAGHSYVGLTGGFGTLIGGRLYTPHYTFLTSLDPFAGGSVGKYNNTYGSATTLGGLADPVRVDNALAYVSPNFGGFTATLAYANNALANDNLNYSGDNNRVYAALGQFSSGMFTAGVSYHFIETDGVATVDSVQTVVAGGSVNLGVAKIAGFASYGTLDSKVTGVGDVDLYNYMLGVTVPIGKVSLKASGNYSDYDNSGVKDSAYQIAVGADYALSKRTNLYTAYSFIDNDGRAASVGDATQSGAGADSMGVAKVYQQGFQMGVRHMF